MIALEATAFVARITLLFNQIRVMDVPDCGNPPHQESPMVTNAEEQTSSAPGAVSKAATKPTVAP